MGYVFDPDRLHEIAQRGVGKPFEEMVDAVIQGLVEAYPDFIEPRQKWIYSLVAGATGIMTVLHGSLTEYVILFGTPIGTEAYSGRYRLEIHDFVTSGDMWTYTEYTPGHAIHTPAGGRALLPWRTTKGFLLSRDCWMLEYGRGNVPSCLPVAALGDALFSAQDLRTIVDTFGVYGRLVVRNLLKGKI